MLIYDVEFSNTVTLGAAIIAAVGGLMLLYRIAMGAKLKSVNDVQSRTIIALEKDNERLAEDNHRLSDTCKALGAEKDSFQRESAAKDATIKTLHKQIEDLPKYQDFMDYTSKTLDHLSLEAATRQQEFLTVVVDELKKHDENVARKYASAEDRASGRHEEQMKINKSVLAALEKLAEGVNGAD